MGKGRDDEEDGEGPPTPRDDDEKEDCPGRPFEDDEGAGRIGGRMFDLDKDPAPTPVPPALRPAADAYEGLAAFEEGEEAIAFLAAAASLSCCCSLNSSTSLLFSACAFSISAFSRASFSLSLFVFPNQSVNAAASGPTNSTGFPPLPPRRCSRSRVISSMVRWSFLLVFRAMSLLGRCSATIRSRADAYIFPGREGPAPAGFENGPK